MVIVEPPLEAGAVNAIVADSEPVAATTPIPGAPGGPIGVTGAEASEAAEVPFVFVAVALNVYAVPFVSPVTSHDTDTPVTVHVPPVALSAA
jgi:hypothetical protein